MFSTSRHTVKKHYAAMGLLKNTTYNIQHTTYNIQQQHPTCESTLIMATFFLETVSICTNDAENVYAHLVMVSMHLGTCRQDSLSKMDRLIPVSTHLCFYKNTFKGVKPALVTISQFTKDRRYTAKHAFLQKPKS